MAGLFDDLVPANGVQGGAAGAAPQPDPSSLPNANRQGAYPAPDGYTPTPAQSLTAWQLYDTGGIKPGSKSGTVNFPQFADPKHPPQAGSYIIDEGGNFRVADQNDTGASRAAAAHNPFEDLVPVPVDPTEDVAHVALPGLARGLAKLAGAPGDAMNAWGNGAQQLGVGIGNFIDDKLALGRPHGTFQPQDYAHPASLIGIHNPTTSADYQNMIEGVTGPLYEPQTTPGKYADTLAQFAPNLLFGPDAALPKLLGWAAPAVASEAAGEATAGTKLEPWARAGAALATGHLAGLPFAPTGAEKALASSSAGLSADHIDSMQALRQAGEGLGVVPTIAESAQSVTGNGAPQLARLQQLVEQNPNSGLSSTLSGRTQAARGAISGALDQIAPANGQPSLVGQRAQSTAQGVLDNLAAERTALVNPYYAAAGRATVDPDAMDGLMSSLDARIAADKTGVLAKPLGQVRDMLTDTSAAQPAQVAAQPPSIRDQIEAEWAKATGQDPGPIAASQGAQASPARVPVLDLENLDRARKWIRDNAAAQLGRGSLTPEQSSALGGVADHLDRVMEAASPDYVGGKANYAQFTQDNIDPVQVGPVGKIAATGQLSGQTRALFPPAPFPGQAAETGSAVRSLNDLDQGLAADLARAHLGQAADQAMQDSRAGPNLYGPAQFAANVAGNAGQRDALMTGVSEATNPDTASRLGDLIDVLSATGRRLPATPADSASLAALRLHSGTDPLEAAIGLGVGKEAFGSGGLVMPLISRAVGAGADALDRFRTNLNAADLAQALTAPADMTGSTILKARAAQEDGRAMLAHALANAATAASVGNAGRPPQ